MIEKELEDFQLWRKSRPMNGIYWGDLESAWLKRAEIAAKREAELCQVHADELLDAEAEFVKQKNELLAEIERLKAVLFDGYAVLQEIQKNPKEAEKTGALNVSHVLDAVVRLIRKPSQEGDCPKCNQSWDAHDFGIPAPYCPSQDKGNE